MKFPFHRGSGSGLGHQSLKDYDLDRTPSLEPTSDGSTNTGSESGWETFERPVISSLDWPDVSLSKDDKDAAQVRQVLEQTGVIRSINKTERSIEQESPASREPLWKRRSRSVKAPIEQDMNNFDDGSAFISRKKAASPAPSDEGRPQESSSSIKSAIKRTELPLPRNPAVDQKRDEKYSPSALKPDTSIKSTSSSIPKSVSFDESSIVRRAVSPPPIRKAPKHGRARSQEHIDRSKIAGVLVAEPSPDTDLLTALKRVGSSFSEIFHDLAPDEVDDLFSVNTPSYVGSSSDDETRTTLSSYVPRRRPGEEEEDEEDDDEEEDDEDLGCKDFDASELLESIGGCQPSSSISDDLKVFGELLVAEASCTSCLSSQETSGRKSRRKSRRKTRRR